jgi:hypothetical protein
MRSWREVPAVIEHVKLVRSRDEDTHKVEAKYRYAIAGKAYTSERVALYGQFDNIGSFQKDTYALLKRHHDRGIPFRAYVNPRDPADGILFRELRLLFLVFQSIFVVGFGGVGFGLMTYSVLQRRKQKRAAVLAEEFPEKPWRWRDDWADGRIAANTRAALLIFTAFAALWNLMSWLFTALWLDDREAWPSFSWLFLLFPAIGVAMLAGVVYLWRRVVKYGRSVLHLAETPGVAGGKLAGVVRIPRRIEPPDGFLVRLKSIRKESDGEGTSERLLWQDEQRIARPLATENPEETAVPFAFAIPYDAPPTTPPTERGDPVLWRLEVSADVPGVDYKATFEVPVFQTAASRPDFQLDESLLAGHAADPDPDAVLESGGIRTEPGVGNWGVRIIFPAGRNAGSLAFVTIFLAVWTAAVWAMIHFDAPILFPIVCGLIEIVAIASALDLWLYRSEVEASRDGLVVRSGWLGLGRTQKIEPETIQRFTTKTDMQANSRVWTNLFVERNDGKKVLLAKRLSSKTAERAVIAKLEQALPPRDRLATTHFTSGADAGS